MTNVQRHRRSQADPIECPVALATAIEIGDLLYWDTSGKAALPATSYTGSTDHATTQGTFKDLFLGVALSAHVANDASVTKVRVATRGEFEFPCASGTFDLGDYIGPAQGGSNITLDKQKVDKPANATLAIGKVARAETSAVTKVRVRILSTIVHDGPQTIT